MSKRLAITGVSSMQAWDGGAAAYARRSRVQSPAGFACAARDLAAFTILPRGCTDPVEIFVGSPNNRLRTKRWHARYRRAMLPLGALYDIGDDRYIASPELFFLETAPKLEISHATLLGMELCGFYSTLMSVPYREYREQLIREQGRLLDEKPWPPSSWDLSFDHQRNLVENGFVVREPLTDPAHMMAFLQRALSEQSNSRALAAMRLVKADSRSPMESRLYERYCFPRRYGGMNLLPVELNRAFDLTPEVREAVGIEHYSVDLYWPKGSIAIEYEGNHAHSGLSAEQKDRLKRNVLDVAGVRVISIDRRQYGNEDVLELYGREIAKSMGIPAWRLKLSAKERVARYALIDQLNDWDVDLYRSSRSK